MGIHFSKGLAGDGWFYFDTKDGGQAHCIDLEYNIKSQAGVPAPHPDLERGMKANPDPLLGNHIDSQVGNAVFEPQSEVLNLPVSHALVSALTSTNLDELGDNCMATFDSNSTFWVCDNSATGHICNDASMFHGPLVQSIYDVNSATGFSTKLKICLLYTSPSPRD